MAGDLFGASSAMSEDGSTIAIGAFGSPGPDGLPVGGAYVFARGAMDWEQQTYLQPLVGSRGEAFGAGIELDALESSRERSPLHEHEQIDHAAAFWRSHHWY